MLNDDQPALAPPLTESLPTTREDLVFAELLDGRKSDVQQFALKVLQGQHRDALSRVRELERELTLAKSDRDDWRARAVKMRERVAGYRKVLYATEVSAVGGGLLIAIAGSFIAVAPVGFGLVAFVGATLLFASYYFKRRDLQGDSDGEDWKDGVS